MGFLLWTIHFGGAMVSVLASCALDREFESRSGQTKDYKIGICCLSANQTPFKFMSCLHYLQDHGYKVLKLLASCRLIYPGTFLWDCEFNIIPEYTNFRGFLKPYEITKFRIQRICVTIYFEFRTVSWSWTFSFNRIM
jgi:hypothetical protein